MTRLAPATHDPEVKLLPDPTRVIARTYLPSGEVTNPEPRTDRMVRRVLDMPEAVIEEQLSKVMRDFADRHRDLTAILETNYQRVTDHLGAPVTADHNARLLIGAYATMEFSIQAAALFNPSIVPAPDQSGAGPDEIRVVMSLRAVGEGHLSCIEFRTGLVGPGGVVTLEPASPYATTGEITNGRYDRAMFRAKLDELGGDPVLTRQLLHPLDKIFGDHDLDQALANLAATGPSPAARFTTEKLARSLAASNYVVSFDEDLPLSERVIFPRSPNESEGMEDARFVRFEDDDGDMTYYATYTAFNGVDIFPQLIQTEDFVSFKIATLNGPGARNKGMALFPRQVDGCYVALSRYDQENIDLMYSDNIHYWNERERLTSPSRAWDLVQMGNCGSPMETEAGWLVLTHGVGPMRTYSIGAILLHLDDPRRVLGELDEPLVQADESERNGYVPNVVYSCGGMVHDGTLVLPYGFSDSGIGVQQVDLADLLTRLLD
ncbi:glycoside hydrolase family 130 protein [soil metagenome]